MAIRGGCLGPDSSRWRPGAADSRSSLYHLQIKCAPALAQRQDFRLAPSVGRGDLMNFKQNPPHPGVYLRPKKRGEVEALVPFVCAFRAAQTQADFSHRIGCGYRITNQL